MKFLIITYIFYLNPNYFVNIYITFLLVTLSVLIMSTLVTELIVVYIMTLSICRMVGQSLNNELERIWKEAVVD
jgi:hypothetical protein